MLLYRCHIKLDVDYRMVKEIITNRSNLISTLKKEFNTSNPKAKRSILKKRILTNQFVKKVK